MSVLNLELEENINLNLEKNLSKVQCLVRWLQKCYGVDPAKGVGK